MGRRAAIRLGRRRGPTPKKNTLPTAIPFDMTEPRDHLVADAGDVKAATGNPKFPQAAASAQQPSTPPDDHLSPSDEPTKPGSAHKVFE